MQFPVYSKLHKQGIWSNGMYCTYIIPGSVLQILSPHLLSLSFLNADTIVRSCVCFFYPPSAGQPVSGKVISKGPLAAVGALLGVACLMALVFLALFITVTL